MASTTSRTWPRRARPGRCCGRAPTSSSPPPRSSSPAGPAGGRTHPRRAVLLLLSLLVLEVRDIWPDSIVAVGALGGVVAPVTLGGLRARPLRQRRSPRRRRRRLPHEHDPQRRRPLSRISVVTNGVDADLFEPREPDQELRARLGFSPGTFVVTFAGTIGMASGLEVALGAARGSRRGPRRHRLPASVSAPNACRAGGDCHAQDLANMISPALCHPPTCRPTSPTATPASCTSARTSSSGRWCRASSSRTPP